MNGWYVWTNRDTGVAGWSRDETNSSPQDQTIDDLIQPLITSRFPQLQPVNVDGIQSTEGTPIVSAAWLAKAERWVFILRGVGGAFGAAGTTQACAAPIGLALAEAWLQFWAAIVDERVDPNLFAAVTQATPVDVPRAALETVLRLLSAGTAVVEVPATPAETIRLYSAVSKVIPERASRGIYWSTCHVASSVMNDERIVTGSWPQILRDAWLRDYRRLTVGERFMTTADLDDPTYEQSTVIAWLLDEAEARRFPLAGSDAATIHGALAEASELRPLTLTDVEAYAATGVMTGSQMRRLTDNPTLIKELARKAPDLATHLLGLADPSPKLKGILALELILHDPQPVYLAGWFVSEAVSAGGPLTESIRPYLADGYADKVARTVLAPYLGDEATLLRAGDWLRSLGLTSHGSPDLFPFDPTEVARAAFSEPKHAASRIAEEKEPWPRLKSVLAQMERMEPASSRTMLLLALATANDNNPEIVERVLPATRPTIDQAIRMTNSLNDALDEASDDPLHRDLVAYGFANWLSRQGVSLNHDLAVALLGLGTGIDPEDYAFSVPRTVARQAPVADVAALTAVDPSSPESGERTSNPTHTQASGAEPSTVRRFGRKGSRRNMRVKSQRRKQPRKPALKPISTVQHKGLNAVAVPLCVLAALLLLATILALFFGGRF